MNATARRESIENTPRDRDKKLWNAGAQFVESINQAGGSDTIDQLRAKDPKDLTKEERRALRAYDKSLSAVKREYVKAELGIDDAEMKRRGIDPNKVDL